MNKTRVYFLAAAICIVALLTIACTGQPGEQVPTQQLPTSSLSGPETNFRMLISDDANAIDKFTSVNVTISEIGIHSGNSTGNWTTIIPDITTVDLKPLIGENALEIWSGNLTAGTYNKVFIYISDVTGVLAEEYGGGIADIKLPGEKLHISKPFTISDNTTTSFVYDITVIEAGKSGKYILQPQIAQSGAEQKFREVEQNQHRNGNWPDNRPTLENADWTLISYGPSDNLTPVIDGTEITLHFDGYTGELGGKGGCNQYFGGYAADDESITVTSAIGYTEMACMEPEGVMEQEQAYLSILHSMESYEISMGNLKIYCGDNILNFKAD